MTHLSIMSYNIRCATNGAEPGSPDHWDSRRPMLERYMDATSPDILCAQEVEFQQLRSLEKTRRRNWRRFVGYGREGGSLGEYNPIVYNPSRLRVDAWGQEWISDQPDTAGSKHPRAAHPRIIVWAEFTDLWYGGRFAVANTHLDHESWMARDAGADRIAELARRYNGMNMPFIAAGDFNEPARFAPEKIYGRLNTPALPMEDSIILAGRAGEYGTVNNYGDPVPGGDRVDWILGTEGARFSGAMVDHTQAQVLGGYPSDHLPVRAEFSLN